MKNEALGKTDSLSRKPSSLWNLTDSSVTTNQRFYKEIQSENNLLSKFYDRQGSSGGTLDKKSFSQKFGRTRKERVRRNCAIVGTVFGLLAVVGIVASVVLCSTFSKGSKREKQNFIWIYREFFFKEINL